MDSTYIDIVIATVLLLFSIKGLNEGFIGESKVLIALLLSIFVSHNHRGVIKDTLNEYFRIPSSMLESISAFASFFIVVIAVYIIAMFLQFYVQRSGTLSIYDRLLGLIFVFLKVFLFLSIMLYAILSFVNVNKEIKTFLVNSRSYPILYQTGDLLLGDYLGKDSNFIESFISDIVDGNEGEIKKIAKEKIKETIDNAKNNEDTVKQFEDTFLK